MVGRYRSDHPWTSVNGTLNEFRKLQTDRRHRDARGAFFIEVRNFVQVSDNHLDIEAIFYSERLLTNPLARKLVRRFRRAGVPTLRTSPERFRRFSQTRRASGASAIVRQEWTPLASAYPDKGLCWVVPGLIRSAGNLGTLIRTSEAIGGAGFILVDEAVDVYDPATVRASMGAHFGQCFVRSSCDTLQRWVTGNGVQVVGASPDGAENFHNFHFPRRTLLFLGEERQGLSEEQRSICDRLVRIPMVGRVDSLNLGVAGSLLMYEIFRARNG